MLSLAAGGRLEAHWSALAQRKAPVGRRPEEGSKAPLSRGVGLGAARAGHGQVARVFQTVSARN
eukprot:725433-Alexandrium_andersonii.AAC.1